MNTTISAFRSPQQPEGMRETEGKLSNESLTFLEQAVLALSRQTRPPAGAEASRDAGYGASHKVDGPLAEVGGAGAPGHVPYRQTALTHCLKPALHVRNKTLLVVTLWPELANIEQMVCFERLATSFDRFIFAGLLQLYITVKCKVQIESVLP